MSLGHRWFWKSLGETLSSPFKLKYCPERELRPSRKASLRVLAPSLSPAFLLQPSCRGLTKVWAGDGMGTTLKLVPQILKGGYTTPVGKPRKARYQFDLSRRDAGLVGVCISLFCGLYLPRGCSD